MRIVTFGEIMLRLTAADMRQIVDASRFDITYGGAEANVAADLARLGEETAFVTVLPENDLADGAIAALAKWGVDTSKIIRGGKRLGLYYLENGAGHRASKVIYDRAGSSVSEAEPEVYDWEKIFDGADVFHLTGITPALGDMPLAACRDALATAKKKGVKIYFDPNYRAKLWDTATAGRVIGELLPYVDVLITNESQAKDLFGLSVPETEISGDDVSDAGYTALAEMISEKYGIKTVALTERRTFSARDNSFAAKLFDGKKLYSSRKYRITDIVDRVGSGDAFAAGLIYALENRRDPGSAVEFAAAAACLKHTVPGDFNTVSLSEIERLAAGSSARVAR